MDHDGIALQADGGAGIDREPRAALDNDETKTLDPLVDGRTSGEPVVESQAGQRDACRLAQAGRMENGAENVAVEMTNARARENPPIASAGHGPAAVRMNKYLDEICARAESPIRRVQPTHGGRFHHGSGGDPHSGDKSAGRIPPAQPDEIVFGETATAEKLGRQKNPAGGGRRPADLDEIGLQGKRTAPRERVSLQHPVQHETTAHRCRQFRIATRENADRPPVAVVVAAGGRGMHAARSIDERTGSQHHLIPLEGHRPAAEHPSAIKRPVRRDPLVHHHAGDIERGTRTDRDAAAARLETGGRRQIQGARGVQLRVQERRKVVGREGKRAAGRDDG